MRFAAGGKFSLFSWGVAGDGGGEAEGNEHAAGDVALGAGPAGVAAQAVADGAGEHRSALGAKKFRVRSHSLCSGQALRFAQDDKLLCGSG